MLCIVSAPQPRFLPSPPFLPNVLLILLLILFFQLPIYQTAGPSTCGFDFARDGVEVTRLPNLSIPPLPPFLCVEGLAVAFPITAMTRAHGDHPILSNSLQTHSPRHFPQT
jgi:hypothetical protein